MRRERFRAVPSHVEEAILIDITLVASKEGALP